MQLNVDPTHLNVSTTLKYSKRCPFTPTENVWFFFFTLLALIPHLNWEVGRVPACVFMCVCSNNSSTLYLSHLHLPVFAALHLSSGALYGCSNCHRSDCSSLDAMEAVIGHPRHSDQCHRYYRDFRHPGPRRQAQPRPKGNWKGVKRWGSAACYGCTETGQLLV